jgi:tetratricopeptide (TPR) repeat protein
MHRCNEVQMIHTRRNRDGPRMARGGHCSNQIDVLHQPAAKQIPQRIRICGKDNLASFRLRFRNSPFQNQITHSYKSKLPKPSAWPRRPNLPSQPQTPHHHIMDKIAALSEILQLDPANAFARYGLAMEHLSHGNTDTALIEFSTLIQHNPDYVPAYQMSAQTLAKQGRTEESITRLKAGLAAAQRTNNAHAASEMQALLDDLSM